MNKQLIFCVEANKQSATDYIYISETLKKFFIYDNHKTSIKPVYMGSKGRYNAKSVEKEITEKKKAFPGETIVIYCIDTDDYDKDYDDMKMYTDIQNYCKSKGYEFVWFCRDVEEVFLGQKVTSGKKVNVAKAFRMSGKIDLISEEQLKCKTEKYCSSNIMLVLEKYLGRKFN